MSVKRINKDIFTSFIDKLIKGQNAIGVQANGDRFDFAPLDSTKDLRLDYDRTQQPPKKYFLPPVETLLTYDIGTGYKSVFDDAKFVLLGVHPYDMVAINQMDRIFSQNNYDAHYMRRRNNATIIASDVVTPSKNVFAGSMGTAVVKEGFDILITDIGDAYLAEIASKKGQELVAKADGLVAATKSDLKKRQNVWAKTKAG